jgi:ubiquinone/menaquinone biosynthesis C-methylase UbiE|tara:strand:+ start:89 stop:1114 length:1026 start_codon:yes stop_codon:yes gene_type:complete
MYQEVYGESFSLYSLSELHDFTEFLRIRFNRNDINPATTFAGMNCLDAGCGNGRGALFMLENGASHVTAVDISQSNVSSTIEHCNSAGFDNITASLMSLDNLSYETDYFDFVWCNGVLMHTERPSACLAEITRVLKVGGNGWFYVYGEGGVYWYLIQSIREAVAEISSAEVLTTLRLMGLDTRYVAEYIDDWKVPYLRTYTPETVNRVLIELGYLDPIRLMQGYDYDTCDRLFRYPEDACWFGSGDLRYLVTKKTETNPSPGVLSFLDDPEAPAWSDEVTEMFEPLVRRLAFSVQKDRTIGLMACARVQRELRDLMSQTGNFPADEFRSRFSRLIDLAESL